VNTRIPHTFAVLLVAIGAQAFGSDVAPVSVTVTADGLSCLVMTRSTPCSGLPSFLSQELVISLGAAVSVSPEGCGEAAVARASSVAKKLKEAGFTKVAVVGFLSEPNTTCAP
jgi:hypothetical protein